MIRFMRLALAVLGLLGAGGLLQARADPARFMTFIEVRSDATSRAQVILREYARTLPGGAVSARVTLLQEIGRSERFVLLESAARAEALAALERQSRPLLQSLDPLLTAPLDRRAFRELSAGCAQRSARRGSATAHASRVEPGTAARALYAVAHLDIAGPMRPGPTDALARLASAACASPGNLRFQVWQQANHGNHFDLVAVWRRHDDFDAFAMSAAAREFRDAVAPWLGSPYDERLYRPLDVE